MPQTYMNRSGQSVGDFVRFHRVPPDEILIVHDELDIPPGQLRLKFGGGLGGHNGLKDSSAHLGSHARRGHQRREVPVPFPRARQERHRLPIHAQLGAADYWRLRIGIGHPGDRDEVVNYVLKPPRREEREAIDTALDRALDLWPLILAGDWNAAVQRANMRPAGVPKAGE